MTSQDKPISYQPTAGLTYDPEDQHYWDAEALAGEVTRVFEICHGCRMCFKYCDSFPDLFKLLDEKYDGDVRRVEAAETDRIMDACFQCKLCEVQCPYTPRDSHEFKLDFPRLVHRYKAQRTKAQGTKQRERILANPDGAARIARASLGMANVLKPHQPAPLVHGKNVGHPPRETAARIRRHYLRALGRAHGSTNRDTGSR